MITQQKKTEKVARNRSSFEGEGESEFTNEIRDT
jgi:hypothetical protein